jgi:hypothetical protein
MNNSKQKQSDSSETDFYVALILRGTEKQYENLLKYINGRNGAKVFYRCKPLSGLQVSPDKKVTFEFSENSSAQPRRVAQ